MNDFTKTELNEIVRCLKYMIKGNTTPYSCFTIGIKKKIQSMIANYTDIDKELAEIKQEIKDACNE